MGARADCRRSVLKRFVQTLVNEKWRLGDTTAGGVDVPGTLTHAAACACGPARCSGIRSRIILSVNGIVGI